ncbi:hypothetical protein A3306_04320 [Rickettsia bellii]|uniref:Uncharacterized protein n=1 Tax=Rickettsia bellii str. RML An4 TaxID=1359193 RepID=A0A0F3QCW0_RICBE|nr:hypothetical protein [Rickettsia bellii]ARD86412.1 hypothetical protein A3306_04320 [Rickettsia bellii]KJV89996.1 hypothetical protein RBEAN4_0992 [Rickettsia bellii str. RML An4]
MEVKGQYFVDVNNNKLEKINKGQEQYTNSIHEQHVSISNGYYVIDNNNQEYNNGMEKLDNIVSILPAIELK